VEETKKAREGYLGKEGLDRRTFLKMAGAAGSFLSVSGFPWGNLLAQAKIEVEDEAYLNKLYNSSKGFYMQDPKWVEQTLPRLQWPKAGERIPVLEVLHTPVDFPFWTDFMRKVSSDAQQLGLKYELKAVSRARRLDDINKHVHGDIELHTSIMRPERIGPSEWLTSRAYGFDRRNYGEWANKQYDELVDLQDTESDSKKKLDIVQKAQKVLAEDLYIGQFGWGPSIVEAYNKEQWDGVVQSKGFGIASSNMFWSYVKMQPKTSRKRLVIGVRSLLETTNLLGATHFFRSIGRMIYDRLAYYDKDLNIIPWAAESWKKVDSRTWDVKLRGGMKFHDGKPVTVEDLQFTFDFMLKYERGIFYTANMNLEKTEIVDRPNRTVRFRFKEPYGEFETFFLLLNVILPKHLFEGIMEKQGVGDDPRRLRIAQPIGSGPFKFGPHKKDTDLLLVANKEHFSAPKIDELLFVVVPSVDGIMGRLETQEIDIAEDVFLTPSQAKQLGKNKHLAMVRTPDINWFHGVVTISRLPWRDFEFRRAWQHSLDRDFLVKVCWEGEGRVPASNTFFVDTNPWHNPHLPPLPKYDLKLARQILKDAGYSWDGDGRLVYPPPGDKKFTERVNRVCKVGYNWGGLKMQPRK
jgi:peptide/nickel transport system substrate-binding protein